jgi:hypothetical protein
LPAVEKYWPAAGHAGEKGVHVLFGVPATEKVPEAQADGMASAVALHGVEIRWPGPAVEHGDAHAVLRPADTSAAVA